MIRWLIAALMLLAGIAFLSGPLSAAEKQKPSTKARAAQALDVFYWEKLAGDPCGPKCTPEWAMRESGFPSAVQEGLLRKIRKAERDPEKAMLFYGQHLAFVTFGKVKPVMKYNVIIRWKDSKDNPIKDLKASATSYTYVDEQTHTMFVALHVDACNNWAGLILPAEVPIVRESPTRQPSWGRDPLIDAFRCPTS